VSHSIQPSRIVLWIGSLFACLSFIATPSARGQEPSPVPTPSWIAFHAKTDDQRTKATVFDQPVRRLKVGETTTRIPEEPPGDRPAYDEFLRTAVCTSELAVLGRPVAKVSILTAHESWIFTDYSVVVERWFRGGAAPRQPVVPITLTVTLQGGRIQTSDGPLEVVDDPGLTANQPYVFLLKGITGTASYQLNRPVLEVGARIKSLVTFRLLPAALVDGSIRFRNGPRGHPK
jgi:hypothetical protein